VDFRNDQAVAPDENSPNVGWIWADRVAEFRIYASVDDPDFLIPITHETRWLKLNATSPSGTQPETGQFVYSQSGGTPRIYFKPARSRSQNEDRIVFLDFAYHCRKVYRTRFVLTIRGTAGVTTANQEETPAPPLPRQLGQQPVPVGPDCADLAVTVTGPDEPVRQGDLVPVKVTVTNHGPAAAATPVVHLPRLRMESSVLSQGYVLQEFLRYTKVVFAPGRLESGASAVATLRVAALRSGTAKVEAYSAIVSADCNVDNDRSQIEYEVRPDVPDLTAQWTRQRLTFSGVWPNLRLHVTGTVVVSNDTQWDAGASSMALFLSEDAKPGPEDRFLRFRDVPALAAGASATFEVARELPVHDPRWRPRLLALLDSSNAVYELGERNNVVVSRPAR